MENCSNSSRVTITVKKIRGTEQVLNHPYVMIITNAGSSIILVYSIIGKKYSSQKMPELNQTEKQNIRSFLY